MFECIDLEVNHELLTSKSSNADNYISEYFLTREQFNEPYSNNAMEIAGVFSDQNRDADAMTTVWQAARRDTAVEFTRSQKKWYRYEFCIPINLGLGKFVFHLIFSNNIYKLVKTFHCLLAFPFK